MLCCQLNNVVLHPVNNVVLPTVNNVVLPTVNNVVLHLVNNYRDQPEVQLSVGTFEVGVLAHVASRISSSPSFLLPDFFAYRTL